MGWFPKKNKVLSRTNSNFNSCYNNKRKKHLTHAIIISGKSTSSMRALLTRCDAGELPAGPASSCGEPGKDFAGELERVGVGPGACI